MSTFDALNGTLTGLVTPVRAWIGQILPWVQNPVAQVACIVLALIMGQIHPLFIPIAMVVASLVDTFITPSYFYFILFTWSWYGTFFWNLFKYQIVTVPENHYVLVRSSDRQRRVLSAGTHILGMSECVDTSLTQRNHFCTRDTIFSYTVREGNGTITIGFQLTPQADPVTVLPLLSSDLFKAESSIRAVTLDFMKNNDSELCQTYLDKIALPSYLKPVGVGITTSEPDPSPSIPDTPPTPSKAPRARRKSVGGRK